MKSLLLLLLSFTLIIQSSTKMYISSTGLKVHLNTCNNDCNAATQRCEAVCKFKMKQRLHDESSHWSCSISQCKSEEKRCHRRCEDFHRWELRNLWRADGRCGIHFLVTDGKPAQCDGLANANEEGPCCSDLGWCGNTAVHCDCSSCTDYAECVKEDNIDYFGYNIDNKITEIDECANFCGETEGCKFWTLRKSDNKCWIKTSDLGRYSNDDHVSGTKKCATGISTDPSVTESQVTDENTDHQAFTDAQALENPISPVENPDLTLETADIHTIPVKNPEVKGEDLAEPEMITVESSGGAGQKYPYAMGLYILEESTTNYHRIWKKKTFKNANGVQVHSHYIYYATDKRWVLGSRVNGKTIIMYNNKQFQMLPTDIEDSWLYYTGKKTKWYSDPSIMIRKSQRLEGTWCDWQDWGSCSKPCNKGIKKRLRMCNCDPPGNFGDPCGSFDEINGINGSTNGEESAQCNIQRCTDLNKSLNESGEESTRITDKSSATAVMKKSNTIVIAIFCLVFSNLVNYCAE